MKRLIISIGFICLSFMLQAQKSVELHIENDTFSFGEIVESGIDSSLNMIRLDVMKYTFGVITSITDMDIQTVLYVTGEDDYGDYMEYYTVIFTGIKEGKNVEYKGIVIFKNTEFLDQVYKKIK